MKRFYEKKKDALTALEQMKKESRVNELWDLKKTHPKRKLRYFVGTYFEWVNL